MAVPDWVNGTDLTLVQAQPYKGDLTAGPVFDLTDQVLSVPMEQQDQGEDVRAVNDLQMNDVCTGVGDFLTLRCLATRTAANAKMVQPLLSLFDGRCQLLITPNAGRLYQGWTIRGTLDPGTDHVADALG